jgi:hypothetical protein
MKRLIRKFILSIYKIFIKLNFSYGIALILLILTKPLNEKSKYRILSLNKSVFSNDLEEIKKVKGELQFLSFPRLLLSEIIKNFVNNFEELNDASYHPIMDGTPEQEKIYKAMYPVFKHLKRMLKFDAIFAGNYVYVSQQELFKIAMENDVPVIVLYKEGIGAALKSSEAISKRMYNGKKFLGQDILFYNSAIQKMLVEAQISGIKYENSHVVGIPRLDQYLKLNIEPSKGKHITLFSFDPLIKAERFVSDTSIIAEYIKRGEHFHSDFIRFCSEHTDYSLTIKTKEDPSSRNSINKILTNQCLKELPSNVVITSTENPTELIMKSKFVAGFLSTTLLEAMLAERYILCPYLKDLFPKAERIDFFDNHPQSVNYTRSYNDLVSVLSKKENVNFVSEDSKKNILEPLMYKIDGNASERTIDKITQIIESNKLNNNNKELKNYGFI